MRTLIVCLAAAVSAAAAVHDVRNFGARGDGKTLDTVAIQKAIDTAAAAGGGTVLLPAGRYLSGTLNLRDSITFEISAGAVLLASPADSDFTPYEKLPFDPVDDRETTYFNFALLRAEGVRNITIQGAGIIDSNRQKRGGPKSIAIKNCQYVAIRGITITHAPNYAISLLAADFVDIDGVTILNGFADGIDPDCSRFVRIANSYIDCFDDAICPKSSQALGAPRPTEHLTVTNCVTRTNCSHFKMGTESRGGFRNIAVSNLAMLSRDQGRPAISGIALESVDGAEIDNIVISNITMQDARTPIFLRLGNRGRGMSPPRPGTLRNVSISNVVATGATLTSSITAIPGHRVANVTLSAITQHMKGGGQLRDLDVPENESKYPEANMFGELPASGFYLRHVSGIVLRDLRLRTAAPDPRPALLIDDAEEIELHGFSAGPAASPVLLFRDVAGALLSGVRLSDPAAVFLRLLGPKTSGIFLTGNDLRSARLPVEAGAGVSRQAWWNPESRR